MTGLPRGDIGMSFFLAYAGLAFWALASIMGWKARLLVTGCGTLARKDLLHHLLGVLAAFLVAVHVVFESISLGWEAFGVRDLWLTPTFLFGWCSAGLFTFALAFSVSRKLARQRHRHWLRLHFVFVLAFGSGVLHAILMQGSLHELLESSFEAAVLVLCVIVFALTVLFWFFPFGKCPAEVTSVRYFGSGLTVVTLKIQRCHWARKIYAGDVVYLRFPRKRFTSSWHPFSAASCVLDSALQIVVRETGRDTLDLHRRLKASDLVWLRGPFRQFPAPGHMGRIWVTGGVGAAPCVGLASCMRHGVSGREGFIHFVKTSAEVTSWSHLLSFCLEARMTWPEGWVIEQAAASPDALGQAFTRLGHKFENSSFFVCGPRDFQKCVSGYLHERGVPARAVRHL